jgi:hypothetical protein
MKKIEKTPISALVFGMIRPSYFIFEIITLMESSALGGRGIKIKINKNKNCSEQIFKNSLNSC